MARVPSEKTQLANARRAIRALESQLRQANDIARSYRMRATQAEQQVVEWKARFDKLLEFRKALGLGEGNGR